MPFYFIFYLKLSPNSLSQLCVQLSHVNKQREGAIYTYAYTSTTMSERSTVCRNGTGTARGRRWWEEPEEWLTDIDERAR